MVIIFRAQVPATSDTSLSSFSGPSVVIVQTLPVFVAVMFRQSLPALISAKLNLPSAPAIAVFPHPLTVAPDE
jgi:hypothetical protein